MIVNYDLQLIFVHITKTGDFMQSLIKNNENLPKHGKVRQGKDILGEDIWNSYLKISIVRNSYDIVVSMNRHLQKPLYEPLKIFIRQKRMILNPYKACLTAILYSFDGYIKRVFENKQKQFGERREYSVYHFNPQAYYLLDDNDNLVIDKVFKFEEMDEILKFIVNRYNIFQNKTEKINKLQRKSYEKYFSEYSYSVINKHYKVDFKKFNYKMRTIDE